LQNAKSNEERDSGRRRSSSKQRYSDSRNAYGGNHSDHESRKYVSDHESIARTEEYDVYTRNTRVLSKDESRNYPAIAEEINQSVRMRSLERSASRDSRNPLRRQSLRSYPKISFSSQSNHQNVQSYNLDSTPTERLGEPSVIHAIQRPAGLGPVGGKGKPMGNYNIAQGHHIAHGHRLDSQSDRTMDDWETVCSDLDMLDTSFNSGPPRSPVAVFHSILQSPGSYEQLDEDPYDDRYERNIGRKSSHTDRSGDPDGTNNVTQHGGSSGSRCQLNGNYGNQHRFAGSHHAGNPALNNSHSTSGNQRRFREERRNSPGDNLANIHLVEGKRKSATTRTTSSPSSHQNDPRSAPYDHRNGSSAGRRTNSSKGKHTKPRSSMEEQIPLEEPCGEEVRIEVQQIIPEGAPKNLKAYLSLPLTERLSLPISKHEIEFIHQFRNMVMTDGAMSPANNAPTAFINKDEGSKTRENWKISLNTKECKVWKKFLNLKLDKPGTTESVLFFMAESIIQAPPEVVLYQIQNVTVRQKWEDNYIVDEMLTGDHYSGIERVVVKSPVFGFSNREIIRYRETDAHFKQYPYMTYERSTNCRDGSEKRKNVRVIVTISGDIIEPGPDPWTTKLTVVTDSNPGGYVPASAVNLVVNSIPQKWAIQLQKECDKFMKVEGIEKHLPIHLLNEKLQRCVDNL